LSHVLDCIINVPYLETLMPSLVHRPRQPSREKTEPPRAAFFSAATQTDAVIDLNEEAEVEEQRQEEEAETIVAESLGLGGEDCTKDSMSDEDSGLDSVSEDEF